MNTEKLKKYLRVAEAIASLSKDKSTQVGAVIIGPDGEGGPWGYNGAPRNLSYDEIDIIDRDLKLLTFEHAERNAIYAAARRGYATKDGLMVVTHHPCCDCARAIIQSGITTVVYRKPEDAFAQRWAVNLDVSRGMLKEAGVKLIEVP